MDPRASAAQIGLGLPSVPAHAPVFGGHHDGDDDDDHDGGRIERHDGQVVLVRGKTKDRSSSSSAAAVSAGSAVSSAALDPEMDSLAARMAALKNRR